MTLKQALARYYRPKTFDALIGQEATVQALINALNLKRFHHAYLFTGTRGVGKTTLARILAKCLSCEQAISSAPCLQCPTCIAIDEGRYVDLIEVDAASRTKVEDTRELLDNVQYRPTTGRFKIYLIDEVHMLSSHSFNALLKTLEEPPPHVKFLLATTDPQKLPLTILSRCLQFHLNPVRFDKIVQHLAHVLQQEGCRYEEEALQILASRAEGSVRDSLSLLEQALAFGQGVVNAKDVRTLLGLCEQGHLRALLQSLITGDSRQLFADIAVLADHTPDFSLVLTEFLTLLHQVALAQSVPEALDESVLEREAIFNFSQLLSKEEIQLYYQIGLLGQRDLPFAPTPKMGFEMVLLRMLAFKPVQVHERQAVLARADKHEKAENRGITQERIVKDKTMRLNQQVKQAKDEWSIKEQTEEKIIEHPTIEHSKVEPIREIQTQENQNNPALDIHERWLALIPELKLTGLLKELVQHCTVKIWNSDSVHLILEESRTALFNKRHEERLQEVLSAHFGKPISLKMTRGSVKEHTPATHQQQKRLEAEKKAQTMLEADPKVQHLLQTFDAELEQIIVSEDS